MTISWLGYSALKIQTKENLLVIDPFSDEGSTKMPRLKADLVLSTNKDNACCNNTSRIQGDPSILDIPGEYEIKGTTIYGNQGGKENDGKNIIFTVKAEGINIGLLGALDHDMSKKQLVGVENVDILFVPVHGNPMKRLTTIISIVEPRIIIPIMFKSKGFPKLDDVGPFLKEMGAKDNETEEKFSIKHKDLPQEDTEIIVLNPAT